MKKTIFLFIFFVLLLFFLIYHQDYLKLSPFHSHFEFEYPSFALMDKKNFFYVVDKGTARITKINTQGEILFVLEGGKRTQEGFYYSGKIAIDEKNRLYVYNFMPNVNDGLLEKEEILRYHPNGQFDRVVVTYSYSPELKKRRESIIAFYVQEDSIYYYYKEGNQISLLKNSQENHKASLLFNLEIKEDVVDITGTKPGEIFFTTKTGQVFCIDQKLQLQKIVVPPHVLIKPMGIELDKKNNLYIADMVQQKIIKMNLQNTQHIETIIQKETEENMLLEFLSLSPQDDLVTVDKFHHQIIVRSFDGITLKINHASYSLSMILIKNLVWIVALCFVVLFLFLLYFIYVFFMKRRFPLIFKQLVIFIPIIVGSVFYTGQKIYNNFYTKYQQELHYKLLNIASLGAKSIDGDGLKKITKPEHFMNLDYQKIDKQAHDLINNNQDPWNEALYLVIYQLKDKVFYMNYTLSGFFGVMYPYFSVQPEHYQAFEKGEMGITHYADDQGSYLAAVAPIKDSQGNIVAVLDIGIDYMVFEEFNANYKAHLMTGILLSAGIFILIFIVITYLMLISIKKLRTATHKIINGNLDIDIQIRSKDEIEELGKDFNKMSSQLKNYISHIIHLNKANARFVPQEFLKFLNKESIVDIQLGDQTQQTMTVLFSDIRSFTTLSETMTPQENFSFLNSYLKRVAPVIRKHQGFIDKYIGDAIMALFSGSPLNCICAAVEMQETLKNYNKHRLLKGYVPLEIGIGIHTGKLMLGIIGEEERIDGTVISDAVNLSSRLEGLTKMYGAPIIVSGDTLLNVQKTTPSFSYNYRFIDKVKVKGKNDAVDLYEILETGESTLLNLKKQQNEELQKAIVFYRNQDFSKAQKLFTKLIQENPHDQTLQLYLNRLEKFQTFGIPKNWDGVEKLDEK